MALFGFGGAGALAAAPARGGATVLGSSTLGNVVGDGEELVGRAERAFAARDFDGADSALQQLETSAGASSHWLLHEARGEVLTDGKRFSQAVSEFNEALSKVPPEQVSDIGRLRAGRALAHEGMGAYVAALADYDEALKLSLVAGGTPDPYILNARGNVHMALELWIAARKDFVTSAELLQQRGAGPAAADTIYARSNAALVLAQLGDLRGAEKEARAISRKAPGNVDMRAALAALLYERGEVAEAERQWDFACNGITTGCAFYTDEQWLANVRRWPPQMTSLLADFLALRSAHSAQLE